MSTENQSFLRFSLEESVWFQKGQEIEELYSLSLEPNVTIQESDQYVVIRGSLDLSGEYKEAGEEEGASDLGYSQPYYPKTIHSVDQREDGLSEFIHRIPVDITIPNNRIQSLDHIDVNIHAFDYFMPEKNCLKLEAELLISGIEDSRRESKSEERAAHSKSDEYEMVEDARDEADSTWEETVEVEIEDESYSSSENVEIETEPVSLYRELEEVANEAEEIDDSSEEIETEPISLYRELEEATKEAEEIETEPVSLYRELEEVANETEEIDDSSEEIETEPVSLYRELEDTANEAEGIDDLSEKIETELVPLSREIKVENEEEDELFTPFVVEARKLPDIEDAEESRPIYANKTKKTQEIQAVKPPKMEQILEVPRALEIVTEDVSENAQLEKEYGPLLDFVRRKEEKSIKKEPTEREKTAEREGAKKEAASEDHLSLTSFLGRKNEEELIGIKVCIVQQGETLDSLAERYEVSVQSLLNSNELEPSQDIYEGQVLYVPKVRVTKN
ncbi:LysM peptidoglycan-binding domain-containing protein [Peribacillus loiseleuriae]|uniref:LysM peptidoglycan-binding domain-containing protein n=1 Tax=Peribacillus loiseleuriae TaxID=1679170 RepID=UPI003D02CC2C